MRKLVALALAMMVLLGFGRPSMAQKPQPVVTISLSGYDSLMADLDTLGKLGNMPQASKMLEELLQSQDAGKMLLSILDKSKPWGAVLSMDPQSPDPVVQVFLPVTDVKPLVKALADRGAAPKESAGGVYELQVLGQTVLFQQKGSWVLVANSKEALNSIPADPATLLGGLNTRHSVAASVAVKNIPAPLRAQMMAMLGMVGQMAAGQPMPGDTPAAAAARAKMLEDGLNQLTQFVNDLDTFLVGLAVNRTANAIRLELTTTAVPGSKLAQGYAKMADAKTDLAGLADPNAAVLATVTFNLPPEAIAKYKALLAAAKQQIQGEFAKGGAPREITQAVDTVTAVLDKTLNGGKIDGGLSVGLAPKDVHLVAGLKIADGAKLNEAVKTVVSTAMKAARPEVAQLVKLDAETYQGVHFHVVSVPAAMLPPNPQDVFTKAFGEKAELVLGIGDDSVYAAWSSDGVKTLKGLIDKCKAAPGKSTVPLQYSIAATPIAQFVANVGSPDAKQVADMVLQALATASGRDHLKVTDSAVPNGMQIKVEVEEGLLRTLFASYGEAATGAKRRRTGRWQAGRPAGQAGRPAGGAAEVGPQTSRVGRDRGAGAAPP